MQRNGSNQGALTIAGVQSSACDKVEATAVPRSGGGGALKDWTTVVTRAASAPCVFTGMLSGVAAGYYDVTARSSLSGSIVQTSQTVARVGVGDVFLIAGQSNVANSADVPSTPSSDKTAAYGWLLGDWVSGADPNPGATFDGPGGTPWSFFLDSIIATTGFPAAVVNVGYGGSTVLQWAPGGVREPRMTQAISAFPVNGIRAVLWGQGEDDAANGTTQVDYTARLKLAIDGSRSTAGWTVPWIIARETKCGPTTSAAVRAAQTDVGTNYTACFVAANLDDIGNEHRSGGCHWGLSGQSLVGAAWADAVRAAFGW